MKLTEPDSGKLVIELNSKEKFAIDMVIRYAFERLGLDRSTSSSGYLTFQAFAETLIDKTGLPTEKKEEFEAALQFYNLND